jgi:hypothetical protein
MSALAEFSLMEVILIFGQSKEVLTQLLGLLDFSHSTEILHRIRPIDKINNLN